MKNPSYVHLAAKKISTMQYSHSGTLSSMERNEHETSSSQKASMSPGEQGSLSLLESMLS